MLGSVLCTKCGKPTRTVFIVWATYGQFNYICGATSTKDAAMRCKSAQEKDDSKAGAKAAPDKYWIESWALDCYEPLDHPDECKCTRIYVD